MNPQHTANTRELQLAMQRALRAQKPPHPGPCSNHIPHGPLEAATTLHAVFFISMLLAETIDYL